MGLVSTIDFRHSVKPGEEIRTEVALSEVVNDQFSIWEQYMEQTNPENRNSTILIGGVRRLHVPFGHDGGSEIKELDDFKYFERISANTVKIKSGFCGTYQLRAKSKISTLRRNIYITGMHTIFNFLMLYITSATSKII